MAGGSTSEEMDAFDDVTPDKPVSIYDLDEDLPTRTQSSDEIAEYQRLAREKRDAAFKAFKPPSVEGERRASSPSVRPVPRESGPVLIAQRTTPTPAPAEAPDLDAILNDVAAGLERLPPAPRVPYFEPERGTLETIHGGPPASPAPGPVRRSRGWIPVALGSALLVIAAAAAAYLHFIG